MNQEIHPLTLEAEIIHFFKEHGTPFRDDKNDPLGIDRNTPLSKLGIDEVDMHECMIYLENVLYGEPRVPLFTNDEFMTAARRAKDSITLENVKKALTPSSVAKALKKVANAAYSAATTSHELKGTVQDLLDHVIAELHEHHPEAEIVENLIKELA